jgi:hypothetical protein
MRNPAAAGVSAGAVGGVMAQLVVSAPRTPVRPGVSFGELSGGDPMSDAEFLAAFEDCTIPKRDWTHAAHVRMAWLYLTRLRFADALQAVRCGIQKYNRSLGNTTGYHDTITVAFVRVIAHRLRDGERYADFRDRNPDLFDRTLGALLRHYTKERLHSAAAVERFIEPDVEPLP